MQDSWSCVVNQKTKSFYNVLPVPLIKERLRNYCKYHEFMSGGFANLQKTFAASWFMLPLSPHIDLKEIPFLFSKPSNQPMLALKSLFLIPAENSFTFGRVRGPLIGMFLSHAFLNHVKMHLSTSKLSGYLTFLRFFPFLLEALLRILSLFFRKVDKVLNTILYSLAISHFFFKHFSTSQMTVTFSANIKVLYMQLTQRHGQHSLSKLS